ncbi:U box domain [Macleaya cordata]|uniref:U-box domain-containing protein n=1 Tax=Macleaya cordata TaxID=56857 RepID=A0A200R0E4_MACCD|nr:U box domain [Macleaya cordata]
MISTWRERRARRRARAGKILSLNDMANQSMEVTIPSHFRCPISLDLMKDPVTLSTGITYDRESIEKWIEAGNFTCPVTNQVLKNMDQIPNHTIRRMIQDWCVENRSYGIERIPTPRIPIAPMEVFNILSRITSAIQRRDQIECGGLVQKIKNLGKESERNRRCIVSNGAGSVLSATFHAFASFGDNSAEKLLEEILSVLPWMYPLDTEAKSYLGSSESLRCMVWFTTSGSISGRRNAVLAMKEILSSEHRCKDFVEIDGAIEAMFKLIKEPICPTTTKSSLMVIYYLISSSEKIKSRFADMGLVSLLVEMLVDSDRSICEKGIGVLDGILSVKEGLEKGYNHVLTIPVLVKKLLRVSDLATEFSVSALLKLCKNEKREEGGVLVEALQVGAFQKLLLLLQVGCSEKTKEKLTELLKLMNLYRNRSECIDSMDFKQLGRPF